MRHLLFCFSLFVATNSFALCNESVKNVNDKFEFSNSVVEDVVKIQLNFKELDKSESATVIDKLVAHKQFISEMKCSQRKFTKYGKTSKTTIKNSLPVVNNYLNHLIQWNYNHIDLLNNKYASNPDVVNDKISDHLIDTKSLKSELFHFCDVIYFSVQYESSDKPNFKFSDKEEAKKYLGITNFQRATLLQNLVKKLSQDEKDSGFIMYAFIPITLLSFQNENTYGLEEVGTH